MMNNPAISILLPIRNEEKHIESCLDCILNQEGLIEGVEVIIADGMSNDRTREIIGEYQKCHPNIILIDNPGSIVSIGMNLAIKQARGEIIIRVDGHCEISCNYIKNCVHYLINHNVDGVGGSMQTIGETPLAETIALAMSSIFGVGGSAFRTISGKTIFTDSVPFPAYTRSIIKKVGFYDEELIRNQDDEYNYRIREVGGKILLAKDVKSRYYSRGSLSKLWKQYYQYGYWKVRVMQKHPRQMSLRQFIPPTLVLGILISTLSAFIYSWGWVILAVICSSYISVNLVTSIITATRKGWKHLIFLPAIFAILHFSYGLGFIVGLVRFANRWRDKLGKMPDMNNDTSIIDMKV